MRLGVQPQLIDGRSSQRLFEGLAIGLAGIMTLGGIAEVRLENAGGADGQEVLVHQGFGAQVLLFKQVLQGDGLLKCALGGEGPWG